MRRIILILLVSLMTFSLSAQKITLLHEGDQVWVGEKWPTHYTRAIQIIEERYPGVKVEVINAASGIQGGINITLESLVASGRTPNVIDITVMRASKFFKPGYALDLKEYVPNDLKKWEPMFLSRMTKNGKVYGVSGTTWGLALMINLDLADEVGWKAPPESSAWTMDSFMEFCKLLKAKGKYGTVLFSGSNPIPYTTCWWASFGVEFFKNGDYSKVAINSPEMRKALAWMREMIDKGYTPPKASQIIDDDSVLMGASGTIGVNVWGAPPPARSGFYPFPTVTGAKNMGTFQNFCVSMAMDKKDKRINQISAELAILCNDDVYQEYNARLAGTTPTIKGIFPTKTPTMVYQVLDVVKKFGIYDMGSETPKYPVFRPIIRTYLSRFFDGEIDAETFIKEYEKAANESLQ